jgi:hypothetical protein
MKKLIIPGFALLILTFSCKKKQTPDEVAADKFMSITAASSWNYEQINNAVVPATTTNYTLSSTNRDSTANGRSYHVFTHTGAANEYYAISGNDYFNFANLANLGGNPAELNYLKDNLAVGSGWSQSIPITFSGISLTLTASHTIAEKGISKLINGITYTGVIHVSTTLSIPGATVSSDVQSYYAPKVGLINNKTKITITVPGFPLPATDQVTNLKSSDIK